MRVQVSTQGVEKRRQQVKPFHKPLVGCAARRIGGGVWIVTSIGTLSGFIKQFFLTEPVVTEI